MGNSPSSVSGGDVRHVEVAGCALTESQWRAGRVAPPHDHAELRLMCVLAGSVVERCNGASHAGGPGSIAVKPAGERHSNEFGERGLRTLNVVCRNASVGLRYGWHDRVPLLRLFHEALREMRHGDDASVPALEGTAVAILDALAGRSADARREPSWMRTVLERLHYDVVRAPALGELARIAGVNAKHLARAFSERHRCTVGEYVRRLRVARAVDLLHDSAVPLTTVAIRCGFADQAHFCRVFKSHLGTSPGAFRRLSLR